MLTIHLKKISVICFLLSMSLSAVFAQKPQYPPVNQVRKDFNALLDRPRTDPRPEFTRVRKDSIEVDRGFIYTEADERMPVLIYKPVRAGQSKFPVAIFLHGTGGNKDGGETKALFTRLAKAGIMGVAIDARYHGQRIAGGAHGAKEYTEAAYQAFKTNNATHHAYPFYMIPLTIYGDW